MALIKTTAIVDAISGKLRGTIFAKNKGGAYMRGRGVVSNPQTVEQQGVRSIFAKISQHWLALTQAQRNGWNTSAPNFPIQNRLGDEIFLSGKALFQRLNMNLQANQLHTGIDDVPNKQGAVGILTLDNLVFDLNPANPVNFIMTLSNDAGDTEYVLEATPPMSAGISNPGTKFRNLASTVSNDISTDQLIPTSAFDTASAVPLKEQYVARFGNPPVGSKVFIRVHGVNSETGEPTPVASLETIVVDTTP